MLTSQSSWRALDREIRMSAKDTHEKKLKTKKSAQNQAVSTRNNGRTVPERVHPDFKIKTNSNLKFAELTFHAS